MGRSEVDRVGYDPKKVTVRQMETWLQETGTYIRTVPGPADRNQP
jgi:hypothetical protein